jgi:hypothetical protein
MAYNSQIQGNGLQAFQGAGQNFGTTFINWKEQRELEEQLRKFRENLAANGPNANLGTGEQLPSIYGTAPAVAPGASPPPPPAAPVSGQLASGANSIYGNQAATNAFLDAFDKKGKFGGKTRSL